MFGYFVLGLDVMSVCILMPVYIVFGWGFIFIMDCFFADHLKRGVRECFCK